MDVTRVNVIALIDEILDEARMTGEVDPQAIAEQICAAVADEQKIDEWCQQLTHRVVERIGAQRRATWTLADENRSQAAIASAAERRNGSHERRLSFLERHHDLLVRRELRQLVYVPSLGRQVLRGLVTKDQQLEVVGLRERNVERHAAWAAFERRVYQVTPDDGTVGDVATATLHELFVSKPQ